MGPTPTDRGKPGTTRHLIVDRQGIPLTSLLTGANRHDSIVFDALLDAVPAIRGPSGQRRRRPPRLHADKAYDIRRCREALSRRHIKIRIARKGVDASDRLRRHHLVVDRLDTRRVMSSRVSGSSASTLEGRYPRSTIPIRVVAAKADLTASPPPLALCLLDRSRTLRAPWAIFPDA